MEFLQTYVPPTSGRRLTKHTDEEVAAFISRYCREPHHRSDIVVATIGKRAQVIRVLDQMCRDRLLTVTWKRSYNGNSGRDTAYYSAT